MPAVFQSPKLPLAMAINGRAAVACSGAKARRRERGRKTRPPSISRMDHLVEHDSEESESSARPANFKFIVVADSPESTSGIGCVIGMCGMNEVRIVIKNEICRAAGR